MTIDDLLAKLEQAKLEGVPGDTKVYCEIEEVRRYQDGDAEQNFVSSRVDEARVEMHGNGQALFIYGSQR